MKNATHLFASTFGTIMALAGIEHGVGEILQGSVAPAALVFPSWPDASFFRSLNGEPALSVIPNLLVTGIVCVLLSLALLGWSIWGVDRRHGGAVMAGLCFLLLLSGGGLFPPVLGMITGGVATRIRSPLTWWRAHLPGRGQRLLAGAWPWFYGLCIFSYLALSPGIGLLDQFFGLESAGLTLSLLFLALSTLALTILSGFARTIQSAGR